jgi:hypothetical protein
LPPNWISISVGTATIQGLGYNKDRTWIIIYNNSTNIVDWDHNSSMTINTGGPLPPGTGVALAEAENDQTHDPIYLVASGPSSDVRVYEGTGVANYAQILWKLR